MTVTKSTLTMADALAERIHADILSLGLKEGDLFMTYDQVIADYGVSRTVAREAISQLGALGVLERRQNKGLLVARPDPVRLSKRWVPLYCRAANRQDLQTLAQLRYALELGAVDLAMAAATPEQIAELTARAAAFEAEAARGGHTPGADAIDLSFHRLILEMTANPLIAGLHRVLSEYFQASTELDPLDDATDAIRDHHMIANAFRRRDGEMVRGLLRMHLRDIAYA